MSFHSAAPGPDSQHDTGRFVSIMPQASAVQPDESSRFSRADVAIGLALFATALGARVIFLREARACPLIDYLIVDARAYHDWASAIIAGDWVGSQVFYQAPLYPYFLALVKSLPGADLDTIRLVQAVLGSLTCVLLYVAGRHFCGRSAGAVSGFLLALYPPAIFFDAIIQKAGVGSFFVAWLLVALAACSSRPTFWRAGSLGGVLGLLMLTREETLLLVPVLLIWLVARSGCPSERRNTSRAARAMAFMLGLALPLLPVALRNYKVGNELVLTTSQAGPNFYIGNNPGATGLYAPLRPGRSDTRFERQDAVELAQQASGRALTASQVSQYWFGRALEFIRTAPGQWLNLMGRKALLLLNAYEIPDAENQYFYEEFAPILRAMSRLWHWGTLTPLAAAGLVLAYRDRTDSRVVVWLTAALAAGVVIFYVFGRYRFTLVCPLLLLAGYAFTSGCHAMGDRAGRRLTFPALAALGMAVVSNWPIFSRAQFFAESYSNAGAAVAAAGDDLRAIELFQKSIEYDPTLPDTLCNLAMSTARIGGLSEAISLLRQALDLRPNDPRIRMMLGTALAETGALEEAATHLQAAVDGGPSDLDSRANYKTILTRLGRWHEAILQARAIVALRPEDPATLGDLAWLLACCPDLSHRDGAAAIEAAEKAAQLTMQRDAELLEILACAYAQAGRFDDAVHTALRARQLASDQSLQPLGRRLDELIQLFRDRRPIPGK